MDKLIVFILSLITNGLIIFYASWILRHYRYEAVQSIHQGIVPRLGGISLYLGLLVYIWIGPSTTQNFIIRMNIALLPLFLISLKEDIQHNVKPIYRLLAAVLSASIMIYFFGNLKNIDLPFFPNIIHSNTFLFLLTLLAFTAMTHAFNIIDGLNGLAVFTYWFAMGALYLMSFNVSDSLFHELVLMGMCIPLGFFVFNYPFGRIFLGDTGAYLLGFILSSMTIYFFNQNPQLLSWQAILLLIYPITEVIYTFLRRIINKTSPFDADDKHLHNFIFRYFKHKNHRIKNANNLATIYMLPFLAFGPIANIILGANLALIFLAIALYVLLFRCASRFFQLNT